MAKTTANDNYCYKIDMFCFRYQSKMKTAIEFETKHATATAHTLSLNMATVTAETTITRWYRQVCVHTLVLSVASAVAVLVAVLGGGVDRTIFSYA